MRPDPDSWGQTGRESVSYGLLLFGPSLTPGRRYNISRYCNHNMLLFSCKKKKKLVDISSDTVKRTVADGTKDDVIRKLLCCVRNLLVDREAVD